MPLLNRRLRSDLYVACWTPSPAYETGSMPNRYQDMNTERLGILFREHDCEAEHIVIRASWLATHHPYSFTGLSTADLPHSTDFSLGS